MMPDEPVSVRVAVLASGSGSNLEALLQTFRHLPQSRTSIALVVASRAGIGALERATRFNVPSKVIAPSDYATDDQFQDALVNMLIEHRIDVVALAGYLRKLGTPILRRYSGRILNVHPSLLPKFGGPGMYGHFVHDAVMSAGESSSGCTVHLVDDQYDHGEILAQTTVPVLPGDTPTVLAERVLAQEHLLYPKVLKEFCDRL